MTPKRRAPPPLARARKLRLPRNGAAASKDKKDGSATAVKKKNPFATFVEEKGGVANDKKGAAATNKNGKAKDHKAVISTSNDAPKKAPNKVVDVKHKIRSGADDTNEPNTKRISGGNFSAANEDIHDSSKTDATERDEEFVCVAAGTDAN